MKTNDLSLYVIEFDSSEHGYIEIACDVTYFYHKEGEFSHNSDSDMDYYGYSELEWTPIYVEGSDDEGNPITINPEDLDLSRWEEDSIKEELIELKLKGE